MLACLADLILLCDCGKRDSSCHESEVEPTWLWRPVGFAHQVDAFRSASQR
jgi:hypothetical protein